MMLSNTTGLPATTRALVLQAYDGAPESLCLINRPVPELGKDDVLVRIAAAPINPSDLEFIRGNYGTRKPLPVVPGIEGSGTVVATGHSWQARMLLGQRVACSASDAGDGTWAEYARIPAARCFPLLPHISSERAATMIVNPLTAWALMDMARQEGHRAAVQTAAASSLGQMLMRLANRFHIPMINIVRQAHHVPMLRALGARYVVNSSEPAFDEHLADVCRHLGATIAFEAVGGELAGRVLHAMPHGSKLVVYGLLSGDACQIEVTDLIFQQKKVEGYWTRDWILRKRLLDQLWIGLNVQRLLSTDLRTSVQACLPLEEITLALKLYRERMTAGKILLMPGLKRKASDRRQA